MMQNSKYILGIGLLLMALAGGWVVTSQGAKPVQAVSTEKAEDDGAGTLDGMTFSGVFDVTQSAPIKDTFIFSKGKFVSTECVKRCGYRAGAYFVRNRGGKTEFISVSRCTYKDAKIVWRGTVENGFVKGESIWTVSRWYRTVEKKFQFEGRLVKDSTPIAQK